MDEEADEERKEEGNCVLQRRFRPLPPPPPPLPSASAAETTSEAATVASEVAVARSVAAAVPLTVADAKAQFSHKSPLLTQSELSSVLQSVEEDYTRKADFRKAYPAATAADDGGGQNSFCGSGREGGEGRDLNSQVVISGPLPPPFPPTETESRDNNPDHSDRPDNRVLHSQGSAVILLGGEGGFPKLGEISSEFK